MPVYSTKATWGGGHDGELSCGNGAVLPFSAPATSHGREGILTPEDAFVGALNGCFMLIFIWAAERLKIDLVSYECEAEGHVEEFLDRTSAFDRIELRPKIVARGCTVDTVGRALKLAEKYSLIWQSIKAEVVLKPEMKME